MPLLRRIRTLAAKIESTAGTAESLTGSDGAFNIYNPIIQPNVELEQRERQGGFAMLAAISGQRIGTATFQTDIEWDGTATEPAWADTFFPACGFVKSGGTYSATDEVPGSNVKTLTIGLYENGLYKQLHGCMGNFEVVLPTGRRGYINWTFQGVWTTPSDVSIISPTYPTDEAYKYSSATTAFNSNNLCVEQITFNSGNVITAKQCADNDAGVDYFLVTSRQPTATASPEADLVANADHYGDLLSHTEAELTATLTGNTGDAIEFEFKKAQVQSIAESEREGIQTDDITWQANYDGAGSVFNINFAVTP